MNFTCISIFIAFLAVISECINGKENSRFSSGGSMKCFFLFDTYHEIKILVENEISYDYIGLGRIRNYRFDYAPLPNSNIILSVATVVPERDETVYGIIYKINEHNIHHFIGPFFGGKKISKVPVENISTGTLFDSECSIAVAKIAPSKITSIQKLPENRKPTSHDLKLLIHTLKVRRFPEKYIDKIAKIPSRN